ncbi:Polypyrimidine tract-binding protein homolog 2-like protein [Drosera capensis]
MASVSSQPQFRYTQPPSKVLHLRNLPWECTEEELIELGKPFGKVVNTKCNVGANKNQAFIEFADLNQAIAMISYYASSSEPAQIRGKTVYLQYSNRQEIVNNKTTADTAGNVLLVTIEGEEARQVSIDVLHLAHVKDISLMTAFCIRRKRYCVFFLHLGLFTRSQRLRKQLDSRQPFFFSQAHHIHFSGYFMLPHNIITYFLQALIQFSDTATASSAKNQLDGRNIPSYLIPDLVGPCSLKITYSAHTDLSVKFQSHRSRDYTNPFLPVAASAIDTTGQLGVGLDGKIEPESNILLASIENMQYVVTLDAVYMVFSTFGPVQKIAMFDKNGGLQALVQYPDVQTAVVAKEALEGHCIYDGGFCKLHLSYSRHTNLSIKVNNDRSRDYTMPNPAIMVAPSILGQQPLPVTGGAVAAPYNGMQYAPTPEGYAGPPASASWGQSMPMQQQNYPYMPPGGVPPGALPPLSIPP